MGEDKHCAENVIPRVVRDRSSDSRGGIRRGCGFVLSSGSWILDGVMLLREMAADLYSKPALA